MRWTGKLPITLLTKVTLILFTSAIDSTPHLVQGLSPAFREFLGIEQGLKRDEGSLHRIDTVL